MAKSKPVKKPTAKQKSDKRLMEFVEEIRQLTSRILRLEERIESLEQVPRLPKRGPFDWPSVPERERPVSPQPWVKPLRPYEVDPPLPYRREPGDGGPRIVPMMPCPRDATWIGDPLTGQTPTTICGTRATETCLTAPGVAMLADGLECSVSNRGD